MKKIVLMFIALIAMISLSGCSWKYEDAKEKYLSAKEKYVYVRDKAGKFIRVLEKTDKKAQELDEKLTLYDKEKSDK